MSKPVIIGYVNTAIHTKSRFIRVTGATANNEIFVHAEAIIIIEPLSEGGAKLFFRPDEKTFLKVKENVADLMKAMRYASYKEDET